MTPEPAAPATDLVEDLGEKIGDLRSHLARAHALRPGWVAELDSAELAALHRRFHGRVVDPDPSLVGARFVEVRSEPDWPATTALPLADALDHDAQRVWLPLRVVDRLHVAGAPGHTMHGGCRACADTVEAVVRSMQELDRTPQVRIAQLEAEVSELTDALEEAEVSIRSLQELLDVMDPGAEGQERQ